MTVRRAARALALGAAAAATFPGAASAAVSVTSFSVTPSTTQAGGHPNLVVDTSLASNPDTDDVKSLNVVLPQGLVGDPGSAGRCSQSSFAADACPADSKVGITTVTATVLGSSMDSAGDVYSLTPVGSEPARLGIVVRPTLLGMPLEKIFLQSGVTTGPQTNFGLSTTFDNLPRKSGGLDIRTDRLKLTLFGQAAHGPFVSNPTYCHPAIANTTITSYDAPGSSSASAGFTPTGCDRDRSRRSSWAPIVTTAGATPSKPVGVQTTIALPAGQANLRTAVVRLPRTLSSNTAVLSQACTLEQQAAASGCPDSSRVGSARTVSPLLAAPLDGKVFLAATTTGLPKLLVVFTGALALNLDGNVDISNGVATDVRRPARRPAVEIRPDLGPLEPPAHDRLRPVPPGRRRGRGGDAHGPVGARAQRQRSAAVDAAAARPPSPGEAFRCASGAASAPCAPASPPDAAPACCASSGSRCRAVCRHWAAGAGSPASP